MRLTDRCDQAHGHDHLEGVGAGGYLDSVSPTAGRNG